MNTTETKLSREEIVSMILKLKGITPQDAKTKEQIQKLQQLLDNR
jgi:hypothetical protein